MGGRSKSAPPIFFLGGDENENDRKNDSKRKYGAWNRIRLDTH